MDIKQAQKIIDQAEAAEKVLAKHREQQIRNAYKQFDGIASNAELITALQNLQREAKRRTRTKVTADVVSRIKSLVTADVVSRIKSLAKAGQKSAGIAESVESSYATVLNVLKGKYDGLLRAAVPTKSSKPRQQRKTNNVKLAELTDKERELIKKAKSPADIAELPKGSKNAGKKVMYALYASVKGVKMRGGKAK